MRSGVYSYASTLHLFMSNAAAPRKFGIPLERRMFWCHSLLGTLVDTGAFVAFRADLCSFLMPFLLLQLNRSSSVGSVALMSLASRRFAGSHSFSLVMQGGHTTDQGLAAGGAFES